MQDLTRLVRMHLVPLVDRFRELQSDDGAVVRESQAAERLLAEITAHAATALEMLGEHELLVAVMSDIAAWRAAGLDHKPLFDRTRDAFTAPEDNALALFLGPVLSTNGPAPVGHRLECFLALRMEPPECDVVARRHPHPKNNCQSMRLVTASAGFRTGNCIVFFPENIATETAIDAQGYAMFFFNKFQRIYEAETLPAVRAILDGPGSGRADGLASQGMTPADCYRARCVWGYLHDYFHHQGPRPLDAHLKVKLNWFVGLLEEIKVDAQTALACTRPDMPFGAEQVEFILLDRMFRYPTHPAAVRNFDAGTGVLLFSWLRANGALNPGRGGRYHLDWGAVPEALEELVREIVAIEVACRDDDSYRASAKEFVRRLLPEGRPGDRFAFTQEQLVLAGSPAGPNRVLDFAELPY